MLERVYAQIENTVSNPLEGIDTLAMVFGMMINVVIGVAIALSVIFLGIGGIKYITSQGDAKAADAARAAITNAVIGLVVAIGALAIRAIVLSLLGAGDAGDPLIVPAGVGGADPPLIPGEPL